MSKSVPTLVLASASPRRAELLAGVGLAFEVIASGIHEDGPRGDAAEYARLVARDKGLDVARRIADAKRRVLSADTIVVVDGEIFEKPADAADAERMLARLGGREHTVMTAYCVLAPPGEVLFEEVVRTHVRFRALDARHIRGYVRTGEPMDKAGAYAAQGVGMFLIESVSGSYSNVVGLPVTEVIRTLERLGVATLFPDEGAS